MGRPKSYDTEQVIQQITKQFWRSGFAETSMSDLEEVTGLNRYSLYKAFGDKESMYGKALEHYYRTIIQLMLKPLETNSVNSEANIGNIEAYFLNLNKLLKMKYGQYGCMIQNMQKEGIGELAITRQFGRKLWKQKSSLLEACLRDETIKLPFDKSHAVQLLLAQVQSQISLARSNVPNALLDAQRDATLALIHSWKLKN